nr:NADP-dependent phosphogluconate dehydrogenase [Maliibacterium massiliense]
MGKCDIGVIGLAVMGQNLVMNMANHGFCVAAYNRTATRTQQFMDGPAKGKEIVPSYSLEDFVASIRKPRVIMLMIQAGPAVDAAIDQLLPLIDKGDIIIDGGNSYFPDTRRRCARLEEMGYAFMGVGVSGGEEGALKGPSIMPGGSRAAWDRVAPILTAISAKVGADDTPCCDYIGTDGAGHYVKMAHNGIEYGDMQLISESYFLLKELAGLDYPAMQQVFQKWNEGELDSYLIEITEDILGRTDPETGKPMVEVILDRAGQKGTGKWTSQESLELGVAAPTVAEAVYARCMSADKKGRVAASKILRGPTETFNGDVSQLIDDIGQALYASKICSYAQGFALLSQASEIYNWDLDLGNIALMWRGGCIIRARFLQRIKDAYSRDPKLANLMLDPYFTQALDKAQASWRRVVALCAQLGVPAPCFASALAYFDSYRRETLPANLIQAQRDYFGAHTYERVDREGVFHTNWIQERGE